MIFTLSTLCPTYLSQSATVTIKNFISHAPHVSPGVTKGKGEKRSFAPPPGLHHCLGLAFPLVWLRSFQTGGEWARQDQARTRTRIEGKIKTMRMLMLMMILLSVINQCWLLLSKEKIYSSSVRVMSEWGKSGESVVWCGVVWCGEEVAFLRKNMLDPEKRKKGGESNSIFMLFYFILLNPFFSGKKKKKRK